MQTLHRRLRGRVPRTSFPESSPVLDPPRQSASAAAASTPQTEVVEALSTDRLPSTIPSTISIKGNPVGAKNTRETDPTIPVVETDFAELPDGTLVEMIEDPTNPSRSLLAVYKNGAVECVERYRDGDRVLLPPARTGLLKHVRLPQGAERHGGMLDLFGRVAELLGACLDINPDSRFMMTLFVLATQFPEKLPFAPYLALVGPPGAGKTTALRVLALLCRRSLSTTDISPAAFYDVCHRVSPTLLIDETRTAGNVRTLLHLLRSSSARGFVSLRKDNVRMAYGPKILSWVELPNDAMLNSRCIIIPMQRTRRTDLRSPDDRQVIEVAASARKRLLQFRFEHFNNLAVPKTPDKVQLSSRPLDLYRALALPVAEDQEFCDVLAGLMAAQRSFQSPLLPPAQASAVRILFKAIHQFPQEGGVRLSALTAAMKGDLASLGEPSLVNERKVGDLLTALGLTNRTRTNLGYVLWLSRADRIRIHSLARDHELDCGLAQLFQSCDLCGKPSEAPPISSAEQHPNRSDVNGEKPSGEGREHRERRPGSPRRQTSRKRGGNSALHRPQVPRLLPEDD